MRFSALFLSIFLVLILVFLLLNLQLERMETPEVEIREIEKKVELIINITEENPRWNHFPLEVYINEDFARKVKPSYPDDFRKAMEIWSLTGLVSFKEVNSSESEVIVEWVPSLRAGAKDAIGDTVTKFIDTGQYKVIKEAKIDLLTKEKGKELNDIDMINIALHEIGHVLGLEHVDFEESIMYPILEIPSKEIKPLSSLDTESIREIYSLQPKPDLAILEASAIKATIKTFIKEIYLLNLTISIKNFGLQNAGNFSLHLKADSELVKKEILPSIEIGKRISLFYGNLQLKHNFTEIEIVLDEENLIDELEEGNNRIKIKI